MFREYLILLFLGHILGDFYIQTDAMAKKKNESFKGVLIHCLYYWITTLSLSLPIISFYIVIAVSILAALHLLIDALKFKYISYKYRKNKIPLTMDRNIFFIDQILHILCLIVIAYLLEKNKINISQWGIIKDFFDVIGISEVRTVTWILALLIIHKPANIIIQKSLIIYKPTNTDINNQRMKEIRKRDNNAGRLIGTIERIILLIFLSIGQYSAIGLVLTAKSIARYEKISKEPEFAEYYLLGTLLSTLIVIITSFLLK